MKVHLSCSHTEGTTKATELERTCLWLADLARATCLSSISEREHTIHRYRLPLVEGCGDGWKQEGMPFLSFTSHGWQSITEYFIPHVVLMAPWLPRARIDVCPVCWLPGEGSLVGAAAPHIRDFPGRPSN